MVQLMNKYGKSDKKQSEKPVVDTGRSLNSRSMALVAHRRTENPLGLQ